MDSGIAANSGNPVEDQTTENLCVVDSKLSERLDKPTTASKETTLEEAAWTQTTMIAISHHKYPANVATRAALN